ncbi:MAG: hypothetical protein ACO3GN_04420, partial [Bacteroidia bacterium]
EGIREGMEKGKLKGLEEGMRINLETTAVRLFKSGMDIPLIADILQIEQKEIERILSNPLP